MKQVFLLYYPMSLFCRREFGIVLSVVAGLCTSLHANGTDYHVAPNGNDVNPGTVQQPLRTIQKASHMMRAGDRCLIRGGTYRETVVVANGSERNPVVYQAYPGEAVTINGCEVVRGWKPHSGHIYTAAWRGTLGEGNQIFVQGRMSFQARWPNNPAASLLEPPLATAGDGSSKTTIICPRLARSDLRGASVWIISGCRWVAWTSRITASSADRISFEDRGYDAVACRPGAEFYVFGSLGLLDAPNEWFAKDGQLYLWAPGNVSPEHVEVEAKVRPCGIDLSGKRHVRLQGIGLFGCSIKTDDGTADIVIDDMKAQYVGHWESPDSNLDPPSDQRVALGLSGSRITVKNSTMAGAAGTLIGLQGSEHRIVNCLIHDAGYAGVNSECLGIYGRRHLVSHNTVHSGGRSVVGMGGRQCIVEYNNVSRAGLLTRDVGIFTTGATDGDQSEIRYNWFHDNLSSGLARGIFLSTGASNFLIHHNVVWHCWEGGYHSEPPSEYNQVLNNTFYTTPGSYDCGGVDVSSFTYMDDQVGGVVINNVFTDDIRTLGHDVCQANNLLKGTDPQFEDAATFDFRLKPTSPGRGTGMAIPGVTRSSRPDLGAYEGGSWKPGHDFTNPPMPEFRLSKSPFWNRVLNGSFEQGIEHWRKTGATAGVTPQNVKADPTLNTNGLVHSNRWGIRLAGATCGVEQTTAELLPNTTYVLTGWAKLTSDASHAVLGVTGSSFGTKSVSFGGQGHYPGFWLRRSIAFTTGSDDKQVTVLVQKTSSKPGDDVLVDDIGVVKSLLPDPLLTTGRADCDLNRGAGLNQFELIGHWKGSESWTKGDQAVVRFDGTQAVLYAQIRQSGGIAAISIDDGPETMVDTYYPQLPHHATVQPTAMIFRSPLLASGRHVMKIRVSGSRNPASKGTSVRLSFLNVLGGATN